MPVPSGNGWPTAIVTLDEAYQTINVNNPNGSDDDELLALVNAVTKVVEFYTGPVIPVEVTDSLNGGGETVILRSYPVLEVESVIEYGPGTQTLVAEPYGTATYSGYGYRIDLDTGVLSRVGGSGSGWPFKAGNGNVVVTYIAGRASVPANIKQGARELIRLHWQPQQSGNLPGITSGSEFDEPGETTLGYFVPYRVIDQLKPDQRAPVVA